MSDRLDREAVDRILARAHRLERSSQQDDSGVEPDALIEAAREVGIDPDAVRDAMAIERLSIAPSPSRRLDGLAGAGHVVVEREIELGVDQVISGLEGWLTTLHRLICDRRSEGSLFARRRSDTSARLARTLSAARGEGQLSASSLVVEAVPQTVATTPTRQRTLVRISADRHGQRQARLVGGGSIAGAGAGIGAGVAAAAAEVIVLPVVAAPMAVGGYLLARSGRAHADRLELELERLLSRVERGEQPTGILGRFARRARRAASARR